MGTKFSSFLVDMLERLSLATLVLGSRLLTAVLPKPVKPSAISLPSRLVGRYGVPVILLVRGRGEL